MKLTVTASMMKEIFTDWGRDYYSYDGCETLLNYYDEIDENIELDVIAICCDCSEFGDDCALSFDDMLSDYGYLLDDEDEELEFDSKIEKLVECLEYKTTVLSVPNGNYIVFCF